MYTSNYIIKIQKYREIKVNLYVFISLSNQIQVNQENNDIGEIEVKDDEILKDDYKNAHKQHKMMNKKNNILQAFKCLYLVNVNMKKRNHRKTKHNSQNWGMNLTIIINMFLQSQTLSICI